MVRGLHYSHGVRQSVFLMFNDSARYPDFKVRVPHRCLEVHCQLCRSRHGETR